MFIYFPHAAYIFFMILYPAFSFFPTFVFPPV
uniref:Uncharacterized protein n=1 Tax=Anguilla anguilla TaxID=7936 RepID=A0A0E9RBK1_ANGAN